MSTWGPRGTEASGSRSCPETPNGTGRLKYLGDPGGWLTHVDTGSMQVYE